MFGTDPRRFLTGGRTAAGGLPAGLLLGTLLTAVVVTGPTLASGERSQPHPRPVPVAASASPEPGSVTFEVLPRPTPPPTMTPTAPPTVTPTAQPTPTGQLPVTEDAPPPSWLPLLGLLLLLSGIVAVLLARRRPGRN